MEKKNKWEKHTAEVAVGELIATGKVILITGNLTLRKCSAADYLAKNHGYIQKVEVK
jgi:hypothetical protein